MRNLGTLAVGALTLRNTTLAVVNENTEDADMFIAMAQPLYSVPLMDARWGDLRPHVQVRIQGLSLEAVLDTGSPGVAISPSAANRLGLAADAVKTDPTSKVAGFGPAVVDARLHRLNSLTVGDLTLRTVNAVVLPVDLGEHTDILLGLNFAKLVHLWISRSSHQLVMQYPPAASDPSTP